MPQRKILLPDHPRGHGLLPPIPAASTSEPEQKQDCKDLNVDVQQLFLIKEEDSWSSSLDQLGSELLHIKEEEEELGTNQEGEQLHEQEETDISRFSVTVVTVKSEDEEEKPQSSQLHQFKSETNRETEPPTCSSATQTKAETDEEDCGGPEQDKNPDPHRCLQANHPNVKVSDSSETEGSCQGGGVICLDQSLCGPEETGVLSEVFVKVTWWHPVCSVYVF
ncbi:uncharacterized protein LOC121632957 isoform X2 [Melanotaenia boesemani]|uniref:uncharacterized protein LOC121632957 isoform X2 n=1 Tax=Melanotaenia boesemani TaxID=1250792 RepID=UPI001C05ED12|nr:uncharacterized protein LOC121632957 isoform X2 [Melanotaenia boesemani]